MNDNRRNDFEWALMGGKKENERLEQLRNQTAAEVTTKHSERCGLGPGQFWDHCCDDNCVTDKSLWPTDEEILKLWHTFLGHTGYSGYIPTLQDFGTWLAGSAACRLFANQQKDLNDPSKEFEPCEMTW